MGLQQIIFLVLLGISGYFGFKRYGAVKRNIFLGKDEDLTDNKGERWKNVFLVALGQKKMFKRFIPAILHFFIYAAFLMTQIELIEIILDGITGKHRMFANGLGGFYTFLISFIEILSILAFVATIVFLWRRNMLKLPRFHKPEMNGWPKLDGNLILYGEILLLIGSIFLVGTCIIWRLGRVYVAFSRKSWMVVASHCDLRLHLLSAYF